MTTSTTPERDAIRRLCSDLHLPGGDAFTQDWAYELPPQFRTEPAFYRYLDAYGNAEYGDAERRLLVQLTLDIANDFLFDNAAVGQAAWRRLAALLRQRPELHRDQLEYWAAVELPLEDAFYLSPLVRELRADLFPEVEGTAL